MIDWSLHLVLDHAYLRKILESTIYLVIVNSRQSNAGWWTLLLLLQQLQIVFPARDFPPLSINLLFYENDMVDDTLNSALFRAVQCISEPIFYGDLVLNSNELLENLSLVINSKR